MTDTATLRARVRALISPDVSLDDSDIDAAISAAYVELNRRSPATYIEEVTLSAVGGYDATTLTNWVAGESTLASIEYPLDEFPEAFLDAGSWRVNIDDALLVDGGASLVVRLTYRAPHSAPGTLRERQAEALALFASADIMRSWAARWVQKQALSVAGDDYQGPSPESARAIASEFSRRANDLLKGPAVVFG